MDASAPEAAPPEAPPCSGVPKMETGRGRRAWARVLHPGTAETGTWPPGPAEARGWAALPPCEPSPSLAGRCLWLRPQTEGLRRTDHPDPSGSQTHQEARRGQAPLGGPPPSDRIVLKAGGHGSKAHGARPRAGLDSHELLTWRIGRHRGPLGVHRLCICNFSQNILFCND